jgi:GNAT superfamily N-acetyltransferase
MEPVLTLTDTPTPEQERVINSGLSRFNEEKAGYWDRRDLAVLVSDPQTKQILGGLIGRTSLGLLFIDTFFVPESLRGQSLGRRILTVAEDEAKRRGCCAVVLYTISFQAPGFYERHGYRAFGTIDCHPAGTSRIYMTKTLDAEAGPPREAAS